MYWLIGIVAFLGSLVAEDARRRLAQEPLVRPALPPPVPAPTPLVVSPFGALPDSLPGPGDLKHTCPVCGYDPCSDDCRLGLNRYEVERFRAEFDMPYLPERSEDDS